MENNIKPSVPEIPGAQKKENRRNKYVLWLGYFLVLTGLFVLSQARAQIARPSPYLIVPPEQPQRLLIHKNNLLLDSIYIFLDLSNNIIIEDRQDTMFIRYYYPHKRPIYKVDRGDWLYLEFEEPKFRNLENGSTETQTIP